MKSKALTDMFAILTAGGRNSGERSTAKERRFYGDPAKHVEFESERARREKMKKQKRKGK